MSDDASLPDPRPRLPSALMDHSFAALGWLNRGTQAVGSIRFPECVRRVQFYLRKAAARAETPAERAVVQGLSASLDALIHADAQARELLDDSA